MAEAEGEEQLVAAVRTCLERVDNVPHTPRDLASLLRINALVDLRFPLTAESLAVFLARRPHVFLPDTDGRGVVRFQLLHFVASRRSRTREKPVDLYPVALPPPTDRGLKRRSKDGEAGDGLGTKKARGAGRRQAARQQQSASSASEEAEGDEASGSEASNSDDSPLRLQAPKRASGRTKAAAKADLFSQLNAVAVRCTSSTRDHSETTGRMVCPGGNKLFIRCDCCGAVFTRCTWIGHCNNNTNRPLTHIHIVPPDRCLHDLFGPHLHGVRRFIRHNGSIAPPLQAPPRKNVIRLKMGGLVLGGAKRQASSEGSSNSFQSASASSDSDSDDQPTAPAPRPRGRPRKDLNPHPSPNPPAEADGLDGQGPGRKAGTDTKVWWGPGWQVPPPPPKEEHLRDRILWDCYQRPVVLGHSAELGYHYNGTRHSRIKVEKNYMEDRLLVRQNTKHKYLILVLADGHNGDQASTFFAEEASQRMEQLLRGGDSTGQEWDFGCAEGQAEFRLRVRELYAQLDRQYLDAKRQAFAAWAQAHPHLRSQSPASQPRPQPRSTGRPKKMARAGDGGGSGAAEGLSVADMLVGDEALLAGITAAMHDMQQGPPTLQELKAELRSLRYEVEPPRAAPDSPGETPPPPMAPPPRPWPPAGTGTSSSQGSGGGSEGDDYLPCYAQRRASLQRRPSGPYTGAGVDLTGDIVLVRPPSAVPGPATMATVPSAERGNGGPPSHAPDPQAEGQPTPLPQGPQPGPPEAQPDLTNPLAESVSPQPDSTKPHAESVGPQPDSTKQYVESVSPQPDSTKQYVELISPQPDSTKPHAESVSPQPDLTKPQAESASPQPDLTKPHAELVTTQPEATHATELVGLQPDLTAPQSEAMNPQPDSASPIPQPCSPHPDSNGAPNDVCRPPPDSRTPQPVTAQAPPGGDTAVKHDPNPDPAIANAVCPDGGPPPRPTPAGPDTDETAQHSGWATEQHPTPGHEGQHSGAAKTEPQPGPRPEGAPTHPLLGQPPAEADPEAPAKRLRGRPPKAPPGEQAGAMAAADQAPGQAPRKRGRPKKAEAPAPAEHGADGAGDMHVETHVEPPEWLSDADGDPPGFAFAGGLTPDVPRPTTRQGRADYQKMRAQLRKLQHLGLHVPGATSSPSPKPPKGLSPKKATQTPSPQAPTLPAPPGNDGMQTPLRLRDRPLHRPESIVGPGEDPPSGGKGPGNSYMVESPGGTSTVISTPERRVPQFADDRPMDDGCTLVVNVLYRGWVVNCNVGDSRTVIATRPASSFRWSIVFASEDQGLHRAELVEHIVANGGEFVDDRTGRLKTFRVPQQHYHFLKRCRVRPLPDQAANSIGVPAGRAVNLGATMGDLLFKLNADRPVLRSEPDVAFTQIPSEGKCLLLMASDGLFNYLPENLARDRQQNEHLAYRVGYEYDVGYSLSSVCSRLVQREGRDMSEFDDCMCLLLCVEQWAQKDDPTAIQKPPAAVSVA